MPRVNKKDDGTRVLRISEFAYRNLCGKIMKLKDAIKANPCHYNTFPSKGVMSILDIVEGFMDVLKLED